MSADDADYSGRWSKIKYFFTRKYLAAGGIELPQSQSRRDNQYRGVWQKRFWEHRIRDEDDMANHLHYIHFNPVKHGYVERPDDWPWSTYHRYKKTGRYEDSDWSYLDALKFDDMIE